jgi:hypothetical protein
MSASSAQPFTRPQQNCDPDKIFGGGKMDWKQKIPGCFGDENQVFSPDRGPAFELLAYLRAHGIRWSAVQPEFLKYLDRYGYGPKHTAKQIVKVRNHMRHWLGR